MGRRGRLEGSLTKMGRAPSRARARDASSPSRRTLCISNIVESMRSARARSGALLALLGAYAHAIARLVRRIHPPISVESTAISLSSEPSPARPFARRAARSATIVPFVPRRRPSTAAIVAGSAPGAAVRTIVPSIATAAAVGAAPAASSAAVAGSAPGAAVRTIVPSIATAAATAAAATHGNGAIPPRQGVFHEIERLEALVPVSSEDEHEFVAIVDADVLRLGDEAKRFRLALDRPKVLGAFALEAPGRAAGILNSVTSSRPLGETERGPRRCFSSQLR